MQIAHLTNIACLPKQGNGTWWRIMFIQLSLAFHLRPDNKFIKRLSTNNNFFFGCQPIQQKWLCNELYRKYAKTQSYLSIKWMHLNFWWISLLKTEEWHYLNYQNWTYSSTFYGYEMPFPPSIHTIYKILNKM